MPPFDPDSAKPLQFDPTSAQIVQQPPAPQQAGLVSVPQAPPGTILDMLKSFGTHFANAAAPVVRGTEAAFAVLDPLTHADTAVKLAKAPLPQYQSKTWQGRYAGSLGDYAPAALGGPGSATARIGATIGGGLGSEFGKENFGTLGELVGGILGGGLGGSSGTRLQNLLRGTENSTATSVPLTSAQKLAQAGDSYASAFANHGGAQLPTSAANLPNQVRSAFINNPQVSANIDNPQIGMALPKTKIAFDALQDAVTMPGGKLANLEFARRAANDAVSQGGTDAHFGGILRNQIDNYIENLEGGSDLVAARTAFRAAKKAEPLEQMVNAATLDSQRNGSDLARNIANRFATFAKGPNMANYGKDEQALIQRVATGGDWNQALSKLGAIIKSPLVRGAAGLGGLAIGGFGGAFTGYRGAQDIGQSLQNLAPVGAPARAQSVIQKILGAQNRPVVDPNSPLGRALMKYSPVIAGTYAASQPAQ